MLTANESVLEEIPPSRLNLRHLPYLQYRNGPVLPIYKFKRTPCAEELRQLTGLLAIRQANNTLIVTGVSFGCVDRELFFQGNHAFEGSLIQQVTLAYDEKYIYTKSGSFGCTIIGRSDYAIAETAAFVWGLESNIQIMHVHCNERFDFGAVLNEQLDLLLRNRQSKTELIVSNISPAQAKYITQVPHPIALELGNSLGSFSDGGYAFVEALHGRKLPFGSLRLGGEIHAPLGVCFQRLLLCESIDNLEMSCFVGPLLIRELLLASAKAVSFTIDISDSLRLDWTTIEIVPKHVSVEFSSCESVAHVDFIASFLRRLAALGDLVKLKLALCPKWVRGIPESIAEELIRVIDANQNLEELYMRYTFIEYDKHLGEIYAAMEHHKGLRRFKVDQYLEKVDPTHAMLKQLLKKNRSIEVLNYFGERITDGDEIDRIYSFNGFLRGSQSLAQSSTSFVTPLVNEALARSARGDFQRNALLMANHTDALCELAQYSSFFTMHA
ncbi:hypothetical protein FisN_12Lh065 [Fistulifera solaris]|uniref:Uncharacterized protein n=1 Tax=Fistulifera solaris TaxID=1519565 RepID=A0A1Z5K5L1_FISSO|nr:hypothetical protein FisN_12Lh065 [Fistulifera solaris]|eukprot:GAX21371.1 hypothetical protein FisN_12Lh065 [Fistulifera solaris]